MEGEKLLPSFLAGGGVLRTVLVALYSGAIKMPTDCFLKLEESGLLKRSKIRIMAAGRAAKKKQAHHTFLLLRAFWISVVIAGPR